MNKYYEITAIIDNETEILYGSFLKQDCIYELDIEKETWKDQGYKKIKIISRGVNETPDAEVYKDELCTSHELFISQAPSFNFEKSEIELLEHALSVGYVTKVNGKDDLYLINEDY